MFKFWRSMWAKRPWAKRPTCYVRINTTKEWVQGPATMELKQGQFACVLTVKVVSAGLRKSSEA